MFCVFAVAALGVQDIATTKAADISANNQYVVSWLAPEESYTHQTDWATACVTASGYPILIDSTHAFCAPSQLISSGQILFNGNSNDFVNYDFNDLPILAAVQKCNQEFFAQTPSPLVSSAGLFPTAAQQYDFYQGITELQTVQCRFPALQPPESYAYGTAVGENEHCTIKLSGVAVPVVGTMNDISFSFSYQGAAVSGFVDTNVAFKNCGFASIVQNSNCALSETNGVLSCETASQDCTVAMDTSPWYREGDTTKQYALPPLCVTKEYGFASKVIDLFLELGATTFTGYASGDGHSFAIKPTNENATEQNVLFMDVAMSTEGNLLFWYVKQAPVCNTDWDEHYVWQTMEPLTADEVAALNTATSTSKYVTFIDNAHRSTGINKWKFQVTAVDQTRCGNCIETSPLNTCTPTTQPAVTTTTANTTTPTQPISNTTPAIPTQPISNTTIAVPTQPVSTTIPIIIPSTTSTTERNCTPGTEQIPTDNSCADCVAGKFSTRQQPECESHKPCPSGEWISTVGTLKTDNECSTKSKCTDNQYITTEMTVTNDRECKTLTACDTTEYMSQAPTNKMEFNLTGGPYYWQFTTDRACAPITSCSHEEYVSAAATDTSNNVCKKLGNIQFDVVFIGLKITDANRGALTTQITALIISETTLIETDIQKTTLTQTDNVIHVALVMANAITSAQIADKLKNKHFQVTVAGVTYTSIPIGRPAPTTKPKTKKKLDKNLVLAILLSLFFIVIAGIMIYCVKSGKLFGEDAKRQFETFF
jgi:hypothetical protein